MYILINLFSVCRALHVTKTILTAFSENKIYNICRLEDDFVLLFLGMYILLFLKPYVHQHVKMADLAQHLGHVTVPLGTQVLPVPVVHFIYNNTFNA